jgi:acetate kinase
VELETVGDGAGAVLVVNAGSTSLKLHLVDSDDHAERVDELGSVDPAGLAAVAHRVVHGGARFREPVLVDAAVHAEIAALEPLAPLHNTPAIAALDRVRRELPGVPNVAVFDTGFHATIPDEAATYAIPAAWRAWGVRRYGFHGLSVSWSAERARELLGRDARLVVCHLGGGCSVTAVREGRSVDTTMGFSPLEGVPMASRSGSVDPGALVYLLRERGLGVDELDRLLNTESGLAGLAGRTDGVAEIVAAATGGDEDASAAIAVFVHRVAAAVGSMAAACRGLDALVFTAGIGENSSPVRAGVCSRLGFLGVELDAARNAAAEPDADVATAGSRARVLVIRAREELVAARAARAVLSGGGSGEAGPEGRS